MQEQYTFLYEVLLEGLLCGSTGVPVENIASHVRSLREAETSKHNNLLEKEFKVLPRSGAVGADLWLPPSYCSLLNSVVEMGEHFFGVVE